MRTIDAVSEMVNAAFRLFGGRGDAGPRILRQTRRQGDGRHGNTIDHIADRRDAGARRGLAAETDVEAAGDSGEPDRLGRGPAAVHHGPA